MNVDVSGKVFALPTDAQLESAIVDAVVRALRDWLTLARPGLCGRLDDLPTNLMARVAERLHGEFGGKEAQSNVRLLVTGSPSAAWECQWTEAVRLRNLDESGKKRPPLLLLVPPGTELLGSLDVDTFQAIPCADIVRQLVDKLISVLPEGMAPVGELLRRRDIVRSTSDTQRAKYLLALAEHGYSTEAAGLGLCLIGLWPHRTWLVGEANREYWLSQNQDFVSKLRHGNTSLLERVYERRFELPEQARRVHELIASSPDVLAAAERVVMDPAWTDLEFGQLKFVEQLETVVISVEPLGLPRQEDGYQVLMVKNQEHLPLAWTTQPSPAQVSRLTHYLVEFVSTNGDMVEVTYATQAIPPTKSARRRYTVKNVKALVRSDPVQLPEGLYRARVSAWAGATNITRQAAAQQDQSNLSEYFWVLDDGDDVPAAPVRKERYVASYMHARRELHWDALAGKRDPWALPEASVAWDGPADGRAAQGTCTLQFGRQTFRVRLSNLLRRLELRILAKPEGLGALQAELSYGIAPREVQISERAAEVPRLAAEDPFLAARARLFSKIRGSDNSGTLETQDLTALRDDIIEYVRQYIGLLQHAESDVTKEPRRWPDRVGLVTLDTVRVTLPGLSEKTSIALLLAPTHPLRILWALQLGLVGDAWIRKAQSQGTAGGLRPEAKQALQSELQPINLPPVLYDRRRVGYLQAGAVGSGWDVYLPADIADKRSAMSRLAHALSTDRGQAIGEAGSRELTDRVIRYVWQHPYVSQLQLNVFNPGDGAIVVEMLSRLDEVYPNMRYDVRLFSYDDVRDDLGSALDEMVNPDGPVDSAAEKYSQSGRYALHPNLRYSKNRIEEFIAEPPRFQAHLSIILDVFRPRIDVHKPFSGRSGSKLFGLVQEPAERCLGEQGRFAWERQVVAGMTAEVESGASEATLLGEGLAAAQGFVAALGTSPANRDGRVPTVRLDLSVDGQNLLYEIHRVSDWVLTIDRHLGIDYFDSTGATDESAAGAILLDFAPEFPATDRAVLMLTTRVSEEIDRLVTPVLRRLGLDEPGSSRRFVDWLRSLSGRLAMRLISSPIDSLGVVGMALARAFLSQNGLLNDSVVIPVDAHIQLLKMGLPEDADRSRTDLIIARRVGMSRQIEFSLVEVKCRSGVLPHSAYHALREEMVGQVNQTQAALATLFDPSTQPDDSTDRPLRNQVLSRWLRFYVGRARRYGLLSEEGETSFLGLIEDLDRGYTVSFRQSGIVFELGRDDDVEDPSGDMPIYRVGHESCRRLLRGDADPAPIPPSWDRARRTIRGGEIWVRPSPSDDAGTGELGGASPQGSQASHVRSEESPPVGAEAQVSTETGGVGAGEPVATPGAEATGETEPRPTGKNRSPTCHYLIGDTKMTPQWGVMGKYGGDSIALDLNGCSTLSLFGVQGAGKSYTMGTIIEMALRKLPGLNVLPHPLAAVVFHYNESQDYAPEFVTMAQPNRVTAEIARLRSEYAGEPGAIEDILVLTPSDKVPARQREFPELTVQPIAFHPGELTIQDWRFLMGAVGNDSLYIRELNLVMRSLRDNVTIDGLRQAVDSSALSDSQKRLAGLRLRFAEQFVHEGDRLRDKLYPGRLVIVDLRDELIETDEALGLFVVMLRVFAGATYNGKPFSKWIAFDEAHKYIRNSDLVDSVVEVIRQMRHQATSILIASQDPPSLPVKIVELSSMVMLHRMDSPGWLKHIQRAITALGDLTPSSLARLRPGEAYLWARMATDPVFTQRAVKIECRPRATQHGGATKAASDA